LNNLELIKTLATVIAAAAAVWGIYVYFSNSRLRRAEWLASLYEKFYERSDLKDIREALDCEGGESADISRFFRDEPREFTDYLNFFEFVAVLQKARQLTKDEIEALFCYYFELPGAEPRSAQIHRSKRLRAVGSTARGTREKMKQYLFAYGTLVDRHAPRALAATLKRLKPVGKGFIFARLYDLGDYPGAVLDPNGRHKVFGLIYELPRDEKALERLDAYEEFDPRHPAASLFVRKRAAINRPNQPPLTGWVCEYNRDVNSSPLIKSGHYAEV
jgi:gamma-glutamylcyclotransferase (GGCT)/AIG2-like uncharacterized protein YtfP